MSLAVSLVILSFLALFAGTEACAVRTASRTRLIEALKRVGRADWLDRYEEQERNYELSASAWRMLFVLLFVVLVSHGVGPTDPAYLRPLFILGISALWLLTVAGALPVGWARYSGEAFIARALPAMDLARRMCWPVLLAVDGVDEFVRRLAGAPRRAADKAEQLEREILDVVSEAETAGAVDEAERDMIKSVMDLDERTVGEIMTPRTDVQAVEISADFDQVRGLVIDAGHSRMPVYKDTLDKILGVLYAKDLLTVRDPTAFSAESMMRSVPFVPETKDLNSLLREFQADRVHIAIVLDEYGGTAGLVTIEDILEELVGEITDEHDEQPAAPPINRVDADTVDIDARVRVDEINEELDIALLEDESYDTVGGYVFSRLGHVPTAGEELVADNVRIEVLDVDERRIKRLRVHRIEEPPR